VPAFADAITVADLDRDPYPIYARLRAEAPVCWVPAVGLFLATRHEDVAAIGQQPEIFAADLPDSPVDRTFGSPTILTSDGPIHQELRSSVDPKYRPKAVAGYIEDLVAPIAAELLDGLEGRGRADLMAEYFEPVSVLSLGAVLGLGDVDGDTLRRWFAGLAEGATNFEHDPAKAAAGAVAAEEIDVRLSPLLDRLERAPDDSTLAHMLHTGMPEGHTRARALVMPTLKVILLGGMQEPGHGAGSTLWALLTHPEQLDEVRADPDALLPAAVNEGLRLIAPIGTQGRRVTEPVVLGGTELPEGAPVAAVVSSANRDERVFDAPDAFDIHRTATRTATFGFGAHRCSGHAFARAQIRIALRALLERLPGLALDPGHAVTFSGWEFRAPRALHVTW
jgi:cytochrome P450